MTKTNKMIVLGVVIILAGVLCIPANSLYTKSGGDDQDKDFTSLLHPIEKKMPMSCEMAKAEKQPLQTEPVTLGTDISLMNGEFDDQHPAIATDGTGNVLVLGQYGQDELSCSMVGIWSTNGGLDWAYEEAAGWEAGAAELPKLDYYGEERQAWGTWVPDYSTSGIIHYVEIPDMTNPEAGEQGWTAWYVDWADYGFDFTSADVACYSNPEKPSDEFFGVVGVTGDTDEADETMMFSYFTGDGMVTIIYFTLDANVDKVSVDIDQSTGILYIVTEYKDHPQNPDGTLILFCKITSSEDWWNEGDWSGWYFFNCTNPQVDASDGYCYVAAQVTVEGDQDIICWTSKDDGESFEAVMVADASDMEQYPAVTSEGETATCLYTMNGNLYASSTENGGGMWSPETQINDVDGTVAEEYGTSDTTNGYVTWTDTREGSKDVYFDSAGAEVPIIQITTLKGGFGITATVENIGTADATNVTWSVILDGLVFLGEKTGVIATLSMSGSETIKSGFSLGVGPVTITVTAGGATKTASGFMLGPLIIGVK